MLENKSDQNDLLVMLELSLLSDDNHEKASKTSLLYEDLSQTREIAGIELVSESEAPADTKGIDPVLAAAILVTVTPQVVTKVLEFLHEWIMRKDRTAIHIKIQSPKKTSIEIDIPSSMKPAELRNIIREVKKSIGE